jgi:hypothetical protein
VFDLIVPSIVKQKLRRSARSGVVVCLVLGGLLSADWVAAVHGDDDPVCDAQPGAPLGALAATSVGPNTGGGVPPQHCPICHWLRSLRSLAAGTLSVSIAIALAGAVRPDLLSHEVHIPVLHAPARSPPA